MSHDRSNIEAVVQHYFDGLYEGDADKLGAIFHPSADLRWLEKGELQVLTVPDWLGRVRKRASAKAEGTVQAGQLLLVPSMRAAVPATKGVLNEVPQPAA